MSRRIENPDRTTSRIGLWQLLDLLAREHRAPSDIDSPPSSATVRFAHDTRVDYAPTDVTGCATDADGRVVVSAPLLGLVGWESALPHDITESAISADDGGATADFFDVFHSRVMQVVHAAWRTFGPNGSEMFRKGLRSFVGDDAYAGDGDATPADELFGLGLSDVLRCNPAYVDMRGLQVLLDRAFPEFGARVALAAPVFVAGAAAEAAPLGMGRNVLGGRSTYGRGTWDPVGTLRISTQSVSDVNSVLPGGATHGRLAAFAAKWISAFPEVELDVPLLPEQVRWTHLEKGRSGRLGFDARVARHKPSKVRMLVQIVTTAPRLSVRYVDDD